MDCTIEAYVDDMLVKSPKADDRIADITDTLFNTLREFQTKLKLAKCLFKDILGVPCHSPRNWSESRQDQGDPWHDVQALTRRLAALGHLLSHAGLTMPSFYQTLKVAPRFEWDDKCVLSFNYLKERLHKMCRISLKAASHSHTGSMYPSLVQWKIMINMHLRGKLTRVWTNGRAISTQHIGSNDSPVRSKGDTYHENEMDTLRALEA